ncbi:Hypothetical protein SCF082_LOCUS50223 [Durusdinium trenchii]|uniref:RRM domain-containing protein n=1 Tax=Durusdinium trenchii TaxID=1381693 RepID=A0ABP0S6E7_9DINO
MLSSECQASVDVLLPLLDLHATVLRAVSVELQSDLEIMNLARQNMERTLAEGAVELKEGAVEVDATFIGKYHMAADNMWHLDQIRKIQQGWIRKGEGLPKSCVRHIMVLGAQPHAGLFGTVSVEPSSERLQQRAEDRDAWDLSEADDKSSEVGDIGETSEEAEDLESQERFGCIEEPEELVFQPDLIRLNLWTPTVEDEEASESEERMSEQNGLAPVLSWDCHHQVARDVIGAVEGLHSGIVIQLELQEWKRNNLMLWQPGNRVGCEARSLTGAGFRSAGPDPTDPEQKFLSQRGLAESLLPGGKKRRECYVGNLPQNKVDESMLKEAFNRLFYAIPSFIERYPDVVDTVKSVFFPPKSEGMFAFVEFVDDVLTTTAIAMSGFELCGRAVRVGRPQHYILPPNGEIPALDLQPLREKGLLPPCQEDCKAGLVQVCNVMREVYFGNLVIGMVDEEVMRELVEPAMQELPEYVADQGPPITKVTLMDSGKYCFVRFQSPELATRAISIFDDTEAWD